jgi:hypothetical protein
LGFQELDKVNAEINWDAALNYCRGTSLDPLHPKEENVSVACRLQNKECH